MNDKMVTLIAILVCALCFQMFIVNRRIDQAQKQAQTELDIAIKKHLKDPSSWDRVKP